MFFIVDYFNDNFIVIVGDGAGTFTYASKEEAERYAKENLQDGYWQVVEIGG